MSRKSSGGPDLWEHELQPSGHVLISRYLIVPQELKSVIDTGEDILVSYLPTYLLTTKTALLEDREERPTVGVLNQG